MTKLDVRGVRGLPEVSPGDDLAELIAAAEPGLRDGDVLVITSKIVSKAEGRTFPGDREDAIDAETERVVARRAPTRIVQTRHGFVLAAAGVDASNTRPGSVLLLPEDPDASARRIRAGLRSRLGVTVAVVVSDTFGRPWRVGLTDVAIGAAGVDALDDLRGGTDAYGNPLEATVTAVVDEVASAGELVKGKLEGVPVAVVRGLERLVTENDGAGVRPLLRPADEDMFRYGPREVVTARTAAAGFRDDPVNPAAVRRAVEAAMTAPAPPGTDPAESWRFVLVESATARKRLLDAMLSAWLADLRDSGLNEEQVAGRTREGDVLRQAPYLVVPCLRGATGGAADARRDRHLLSMGAAVENLLVSLTAEGLGSRWSPATMYCPGRVRHELDLPDAWEPAGALGVGHPATRPAAHPSADVDGVIAVR